MNNFEFEITCMKSVSFQNEWVQEKSYWNNILTVSLSCYLDLSCLSVSLQSNGLLLVWYILLLTRDVLGLCHIFSHAHLIFTFSAKHFRSHLSFSLSFTHPVTPSVFIITICILILPHTEGLGCFHSLLFLFLINGCLVISKTVTA